MGLRLIELLLPFAVASVASDMGADMNYFASCTLSYSGMRLNLRPSASLAIVCFTRPFPRVLKVCTCGVLPIPLRGAF